MAIRYETPKNIDKGIDRTVVPRVVNLRNILELVDHAFNNGTFAQQQLVHHRHQSILHDLLESRDEPNVEGLP